MLLGHWYLVVRGMAIDPLKRLTIATLAATMVKIAVIVLPLTIAVAMLTASPAPASASWFKRHVLNTNGAKRTVGRVTNPNGASRFVKRVTNTRGIEHFWKTNKAGAVVMMAAINAASAMVSMRNMRNVQFAKGR